MSQRQSMQLQWLGMLVVVFGLLLAAQQGNEALKQAVIAPGTAAELGIPADCREDELEEEALTLRECELMVASVQITLASSPAWFRPLQLATAGLAALLALASLPTGFALVRGPSAGHWRYGMYVIGGLLALDCIGFIAAVNTGPMLRAQYLWTALLWIFIHLAFFSAFLAMATDGKSEE